MNQETALNILKTGGNVFLTGEPGAGKTYVISQYIAWLESCGVSVAVTASTGIAATHVGGMTIHAWSGIGARDTLTRQDVEHIIAREVVVKRIKKAKVLVIDEISMLDGKLLDMVNAVCVSARQSTEPFGGLQVILVGDFFQLPPITRMGETTRYAFDSRAWIDASLLVCYLTEQYRQDDMLLLELLQAVRRNEVEEEHFALLKEQVDIAYEGIEATRLYTHNSDVDQVNAERLKELPSSIKRYSMASYGNKHMVETLTKHCLSPISLELKIDAMVMCTKNNFEVGYVNGTLGRVVEFEAEEGYPVIETADGRRIVVKPTTWSIAEDKKVLAEISQVPLRLAWAITIHKSQGMSLDAAEIDLSKAFVFGQGYVALSRVRTLSGLKMLGMNPTALRVDPRIVTMDEQFRTQSDSAESALTVLETDELKTMHAQFIQSSGGTYHENKVSPSEQKKYERVKKVSTLAETKALLQSGLTVSAIAKKRDMSPSTIWTHVERLVGENDIALDDMVVLVQDPDWLEAKKSLMDAITKHGIEKLKPLYEETNEKFDYNLIRLARIVHILEVFPKKHD